MPITSIRRSRLAKWAILNSHCADVGFLTGSELGKTSLRRMLCGFLDDFKKSRKKCMLGNGLPHLGRAPTRGNQITLKVYQPSFIRLSARKCSGEQDARGARKADGRDQSLIASQGT